MSVVNIDPTGDFLSSDKIRIAIYLSPFSNGNSYTGKTIVLGNCNEAQCPPTHGMGTVGYRIGWVNRAQYEAAQGFINLPTMPVEILAFDEGRYIYAQDVNGRNLPTDAEGEVLSEGSVIRMPLPIRLSAGDRIVNSKGETLAEISEKTGISLPCQPGQRLNL